MLLEAFSVQPSQGPGSRQGLQSCGTFGLFHPTICPLLGQRLSIQSFLTLPQLEAHITQTPLLAVFQAVELTYPSGRS